MINCNVTCEPGVINKLEELDLVIASVAKWDQISATRLEHLWKDPNSPHCV